MPGILYKYTMLVKVLAERGLDPRLRYQRFPCKIIVGPSYSWMFAGFHGTIFSSSAIPTLLRNLLIRLVK